MASSADPVVLEKITHYREGEVMVVTPQGDAPIPLREPETVGAFVALLKKLKASDEIAEPLEIGGKTYTLAPSLIVDSIGGPVFWEESLKLIEKGRA